ncbi:MAG: hypothetical protein U0840_14705 [Gemmataceae bacterium]
MRQLNQHLARGMVLGIGIVLGVGGALAAPEIKQPPLTPTGEKLRARYEATLAALQAEIVRVLPSVSEQRKSDFQSARQAVRKARADVRAAQQPLDKLATAAALVGHAKGKWLGGAEKGIAAAEAALKKATNEAQREAAKKQLAHWRADKVAGLKALADRQAALDAAKANEAKHREASQAARAVLVAAEADEQKAATALLAEVAPFLSNDKLDAKLVQCAVLAHATPKGLAEFAQQNQEQEALVDQLLADTGLMKQMLEADGATGGKYGRAMQILAEIRKSSPRSEKGILHRLALGTALQHAVPVAQRNAVARKDAPLVVDPVKRYLHYEKAYLDGELDPAFKDMSAWECRMIIDSSAPDHVLAWGREMLRNYRPDHILNKDYGWRYSGAVRTDVAYRSSHLLHDNDSLEFFQNVCKEGGICGRRAFFGRFIVQAFGLPSVPRPQTGHASLGRWTPDGWVINLGATWGVGKGVGGRTDLDFVLETQVRKHPEDHIRALRAQWVGDALGEEKYNGHKQGSGGFWNTVAHYEKKAIVTKVKPRQLVALGTELREKNESAATRATAVAKAIVTEADRKATIAPDGVITVPSGACTGRVHHVKSFLGGLQLLCGGGAFQCEIDVPAAGKYALTARVVTVHEGRSLPLAVNKARSTVTMAIPYTCGQWGKTTPVEVTLARGKNVLNFLRPTGNLSIKDFTLTPMK